ncbi:MAG: GIY-YIG nuclease family protein [Telluria sp.]
MSAYVYILASHRYGTLYIGVTSDLVKRIYQHKTGACDGFTKQNNVKLLVWYECHAEITAAIEREKQLKHWNRVWKIELVSKFNPLWRDLYTEIL